MAFVVSLVLLAVSAHSVHGGSYLITSPNSIIRGVTYDLAVEILNSSNVVDVEARIQNKIYNGKTRRYDVTVLTSAKNRFRQGTPGLLSMAIDDTMTCSSCQLYIRGTGGLQFERTNYISIKSNLVSLLIQTDKAIYKPGQTVRYRALAVYPDMRVYTGPLNVEIKDPRNNKIKVERGRSSQTGVVEGQLELSDQPRFGDWMISVSLQNTRDQQSQPFTVADYDLPRFEVKVELPSFKLTADQDLSGTVNAKYTFGQAVKGMVELYVGPDRDPDTCGKMAKSVETVFEIDGEATFTIPKSDIQRVTSIYDNSRVRVTAFVKEAATGVRLNGSNVVTYYQNNFKIKFLENTPSVFKPGLPFVAFIQVSTPDDLPPPVDTQSIVSVYAYASYLVKVDDVKLYGIASFTGTYPLPGHNATLPTNGILPIGLDIPDNATSITINVHYKGQNARKTITKTFSESNNFIQLSLENTNVKEGDYATFKLIGTEPLQSIFYVVLSRGSIVLTGNVNGQGAKQISFSLAITSALAPTAQLLAYYDKTSSEIVADSIAFNVDGIFSNKVSLAYNVDKSEPNKQVDLLLTADPNSVVCVLAVDQSVLLLKSGNDITAAKVKDALSKFDSTQKPMDSEYALSFSSRSVADVFRQTGLMVITDVKMVSPPSNRIDYPRQRPPGGQRRYPNMPVPTALPRPKGIQDDSFGGGGGSALKKVEHIRKVFPEAWLWQSVRVSASGLAHIKATVPDTITSWVTSAFATNRLSGLGVAPTSSNLTVFRPFFVSLSYPRSMKRNEQAVIQATVFNYLSIDVQVVVTMKQNSYYQIISIASDGTQTIPNGDQSRTINVKSGAQGVAFFPIVATQFGVADVDVTAQSTAAADGVKRQITIEAEGAPENVNYAIFVNSARLSSKFTENIALTLPHIVPGSDKTRVKVSGDVFGPSLDNIESLLTIPTGCGEQSMVKFAPDLYIAKYLNASGQWSAYWSKRISSLLNTGYQRQLTYQRYDGGFSAFGDSDEAGSTWLTAFVLRTFNEAREFIYVDPDLLVKSMDWLIERQNKDGSFAEIGRILDQNTQGNKRGTALTAYVLLALLKNRDIAPLKDCKLTNSCPRAQRLEKSISEAIANLETKLTSTTDLFSLSVVTYALGEARSTKADEAFARLVQRAKHTDKNGDGMTYWSATATTTTGSSSTSRNTFWKPPRAQARPIDILITSYALLSYTSRGQISEAIPVVKWLVLQRNGLGGFASTQDTVVALQALSTYATKTVSSSTNARVQATGDSSEMLDFTVTQSNALVLQTKQFQISPAQVKVEITGAGLVLAEVEHSFHTKTELTIPAFDVSTVLLDDSLDSFNLMICTKWLQEHRTGMVVQEIGIPSGFQPDLSSLGQVVGMKRSERKGSVVAIYFDEIVKTSTCYSILMTRVGKVAKSEQSYIRTYDYYEPEYKSTVFYLPTKLRDSTICDVCKKCC